MLEKIRAIFFPGLLRKTIANQSRKRKAHTIASAQTVGILFDASEEKDRLDILHFEEKLKEVLPRKRVRLLGYVDNEHTLGQTLFPQFTPKDLRWNGKPAGDAIDAFLKEDIDLLICLNTRDIPAMAWVAAAIRAAMKIGTQTKLQHDFDMILETPPEKGVPFFVEQLEFYLNKIIPAQHYATTSAP